MAGNRYGGGRGWTVREKAGKMIRGVFAFILLSMFVGGMTVIPALSAVGLSKSNAVIQGKFDKAACERRARGFNVPEWVVEETCSTPLNAYVYRIGHDVLALKLVTKADVPVGVLMMRVDPATMKFVKFLRYKSFKSGRDTALESSSI